MVVRLKLPEAYFRENEVAEGNLLEVRVLTTDKWTDGFFLGMNTQKTCLISQF